MKVDEIIKVLQKFPEDEDVTVLYPEDSYGEAGGVIIAEIAYIMGTNTVRNGVYIKLG